MCQVAAARIGTFFTHSDGGSRLPGEFLDVVHTVVVHKTSYRYSSTRSASQFGFRVFTVLALVLTALIAPRAALAVESSLVQTTSVSDRDRSATVVGARLSRKFLTLLQDKDAAGLRSFLSPAFQLQRANGSGATKAEYLKDLPSIGEFTLTNAVGTLQGDTLVVRYEANVEGVVDGYGYSPGPAPRISTFNRSGGRWQLVSHANFNALQGDAATPGVEVLLSKVMTTVLGQPLVYPGPSPAQLSSSVLTLSPGQETGWHFHEAPLYAYVMSGTVEVTYEGGITKTYPQGTAIVEAIGTPHNGRNPGSTDAVLVVVNIGAEGVANTVTL